MILDWNSFEGVLPSVDVYLLPPNAAQQSVNVRYFGGAIRAFNDKSSVYTSGKSAPLLTLYRFNVATASDTNYWFTFGNRVSVQKGPVPDDTTERTYYTGDGVPKVTDSTLALAGGGSSYPNNYYNLGVPAPTNVPTITEGGGGAGVEEERAYVYTYVTGWGEESAPSPPSLVTTVWTGDTNTVGNMGTSAPAGAYNILYKRIYRTVTVNGQTDYFYVGQVGIATATFADTASIEVGEPLPTATWDVPPTDMHSLVLMPNGIMVGASKNTICPSESYTPYAYPDAYRMTTEYDVVGMCAFGQSVAVGTVGNPYLLTGSDPATLSLDKLAAPFACSSARSMVSVGDGVIYASPDGLVYIGVDGVRLLTKDLFLRKDWFALVPSSMHAVFHQGKYFGFYDTGSVQGGFIFDPFSPSNNFTFTNVWATAAYVDPVTEAMYLCVGQVIYKWEAAAGLITYTRRTKDTSVANPQNFGAAQVLAASYSNLSATFYFDGGNSFTKTVTSEEPFRLPAGYKTRNVSVLVTGTDTVRRILVASSLRELKGV